MTETTAAVTAAALPPYSGPSAACAKCRNVGALTRYRGPQSGRTLSKLNGKRRPGPLPERLERECHRCDYQWDEALPADDRADGGLSVTELAHALDNATPYRIELHPEVAQFMAERLFTMCAFYPIPECVVWQPEEPPPPAVDPLAPETVFPDQQQETD